MSAPTVVLVVPPFVPLHSASLGISLLKGGMNTAEISSKVLYLNIDFAKAIGVETYDRIAAGEPARVDLIGEWIFTAALYPPNLLDDLGFERDVLNGISPHHAPQQAEHPEKRQARNEMIKKLRQLAPAFVDIYANRILAEDPDIVGFTSIFHSHISSIAIATRIKELRPDVITIMGGSNCDGEMGRETALRFVGIDAVVSGEADEIFIPLIRGLLAGHDVSEIPGVHVAARPRNLAVSAPPVTDMNILPYPDHSDYFKAIEESEIDFSLYEKPHIAFEASRGCWWGEKHHCTFCGLNGSTIRFRSKASNRAYAELEYLVDKFPGYQVAVSDCIMDHLYHGEFFDKLIEGNLNIKLFFEVKSNLHKGQIEKMKLAGVTRIQPGIESFSDSVLKIMKKGVTGLQNIQTLKWCREFGVKTAWGLIWGFPGEDPFEYVKMQALIPKISHFQAPEGMSQIRLDRFSPNYNSSEEHGFRGVKPFPAYKYIFPFSEESVSRLAYFFTYDYVESFNPSEYVSGVVAELQNWVKMDGSIACFYIDKNADGMLLYDNRPGTIHEISILEGMHADIIRLSDSIVTVQQLWLGLKKNGFNCLIDDVEGAVNNLVECQMLLSVKDKVLALPIPIGRFRPNEKILSNFIDAIQAQSASITGVRIKLTVNNLMKGRTDV